MEGQRAAKKVPRVGEGGTSRFSETTATLRLARSTSLILRLTKKYFVYTPPARTHIS